MHQVYEILSLSNTFKEANVFSQYKVQLQAVKEASPIVLALPSCIISERQLEEEWEPAMSTFQLLGNKNFLIYMSAVSVRTPVLSILHKRMLEDHNSTPIALKTGLYMGCDIECHKRVECIFFIINFFEVKWYNSQSNKQY